jgi:hypothetical protein
MEVPPKERKPNFSFLFIFLCIILISSIGISGFILPTPTKWKPLDDCEWIEGTIIHKSSKPLICMGDFCHSEYSVVVQDENNKNYTIYVSPAHYMVISEGQQWDSPIC